MSQNTKQDLTLVLNTIKKQIDEKFTGELAINLSMNNGGFAQIEINLKQKIKGR